MPTSSSSVMLPGELADRAGQLAWEFNSAIEETEDIRSDQLRSMARKLDQLADQAERVA